jgi:hypothetical protein
MTEEVAMRRPSNTLSVLPLVVALALQACATPDAAPAPSAAPAPTPGDQAAQPPPISAPGAPAVAVTTQETAPPDVAPPAQTFAVTAQAPDAMPPAPPALAAITFFDADVFDTQLSKAMTAQGPVTVRTIDGVTLNEMPKRLNTWLSQIQDRGGDVTVQTTEGVDPATGKTRGLESLAIGAVQYIVETVYTHYHDAQLYGPAEGYNATLVVMPGSSRLQEIRFTRKDS